MSYLHHYAIACIRLLIVYRQVILRSSDPDEHGGYLKQRAMKVREESHRFYNEWNARVRSQPVGQRDLCREIASARSQNLSTKRRGWGRTGACIVATSKGKAAWKDYTDDTPPPSNVRLLYQCSNSLLLPKSSRGSAIVVDIERASCRHLQVPVT